MNRLLSATSESLRRHGFSSSCVPTAHKATDRLLELIPAGSLVGVGDSVTIRQVRAVETLRDEGRIVIDAFSQTISELMSEGQVSIERGGAIARLAANCEFFITGTNAVTQDGKLVNIDAYGNRVAGMMFGPEVTVIVAGRNKIVRDQEEAVWRIKNTIAPEHARFKWKDTPCADSGRCGDCNSPERLCSVTAIMERSPGYASIHVLLVDEDLGLGWDEGWSQDRIDRIRESYASHTWLRTGSRRPPLGGA